MISKRGVSKQCKLTDRSILGIALIALVHYSFIFLFPRIPSSLPVDFVAPLTTVHLFGTERRALIIVHFHFEYAFQALGTFRTEII